MLAYTTYSEAGGVGKTTTAANLAVAHARAGLNPLVVPLDPQDGDLSRLFDVDEHRTDSVDNLVRHMIRRPSGDFDDLLKTVEGVDIIPEHNMLSDLAEYLQREKDQAEAMGEAFGMHTQLLRVLREAEVPKNTMSSSVIRPQPKVHISTMPLMRRVRWLSRSNQAQRERQLVEGLESLVVGLQEQLDVDVGVLASVPIGFKNTRDQRKSSRRSTTQFQKLSVNEPH